MANLRNDYVYNKFDLKLSAHEYYDLYLSPDAIYLPPVTNILTGDTLAIYFDFNDPNIYSTGVTSADTIFSSASWVNAINSGVTLNDIGLTGIDNGLIKYQRLTGDTANTLLVSAMTTSSIILSSGDTRLTLNSVTGNSDTYIYPISILSGAVGNYAQFCGGFYQGFYKLDGFEYDVLPNRVNKGWVAEFWLNKTNPCSGFTGTTLNDINPNNKGIFFYLGTRAENKFWNTFYGLNTGCTSDCDNSDCLSGETATTGCTIPKETNSFTSTGFPLSPSSYHVDEYCNQFLIYDRTKSGFTACEIGHADCISITSTTKTNPHMPNLFTIMDRTTSGETACTYTGRTIDLSGSSIDVNNDIADNALAFIIKDDGSIGYRLLSVSGSCTGGTITGLTITEEFSQPNLINDDEWTHIAIRYVADYTYDDCELQYKPKRPGKLMFYVNSKLKFIVRDFPEFIAKRLIDDYSKQEGVPFNISLGGGSQGLIDSKTLDGPDPSDLNLYIQENFGGSFIGGISKFRFYVDELCYCTIQDNFNIERNIYI